MKHIHAFLRTAIALSLGAGILATTHTSHAFVAPQTKYSVQDTTIKKAAVDSAALRAEYFRRRSEEIKRKIEANKATAPDIALVRQVLDLYSQRTNIDALMAHQETTGDGIDMMSGLLCKISRKGKESNMTIIRQPLSSNGFALIIAPVDPAVYGHVRILDSHGTTIWQGEVTTQTTIDLGNQPSGLYFVQGVGRMLPVQVVR